VSKELQPNPLSNGIVRLLPELDLLVSRRMLKVLAPDTPLYKWHQERVKFLEGQLQESPDEANNAP